MSGVGGVCACVGWLVFVGVCLLVCVVWFRMLTCLASFFFLVLFFVLSCCLVNNGGWVVWRVWLGCLAGGVVGRVGCLGGCAVRGSVLWFLVVWCGVIGLLSFVVGSRAWVVCGRVFVGWCVQVGVSGACGCLGVGCVVAGGVLPVWLRGAVVLGGVSVGFDVGERVFMLGGVSVPVSGSVVPVSPDAGVGVPGSVAGGVRVCVPCARAVFGDSWCSLVLRRWVRAAGVGGVKVDVLLGSAPVSGFVRSVVSGGVASSRVPVVSSGLSSPSCSPSLVSGGSVSLYSGSASAGGGRVGAGFGARVRDWGARVGVGGGVVSGGGVVAGWWARACGVARGLVGGVSVLGLVLAGVVGVVVLVSVLVCFL